VDSLHDLRSDISSTLNALGIPVEVHHHEVASAGQCEIGTRFSTLLQRADWSQIFKYVVKNVAQRYGKTATFMPKPIVGDNGSGMHVHQSLWQNGVNLFSGDSYANLSQLALYYIGGIIKHARALNAITNPSINSYRRLVPGFEAPVNLTYSARNRSSAIRIPYVHTAQAARIEVRFPDALANPYLAFSAMMMAGIDGIVNAIMPLPPCERDLYTLSATELAAVPNVADSLQSALQFLHDDRDFLLAGGVFSNELLDSFIAIKQQEVQLYRTITNPIEFAMYYSI
jgi:glutamine synthetase